MTTLRRLLYFVFGLLLGAVVTLAHAETMAPIPGWRLAGVSVYYGEDLATLCQAAVAEVRGLSQPQYRYHSVSTNIPYACNVSYYPSTSKYGSYGTISPMNVCPYGQGWTLSGGVCTKPDACPAAGTGTGTNEDSVSPSFPNLFGWNDPGASASRGGSGTYCSSGCSVAYQATVCVQSTQPGTNNCAALNTSYTGATCTGTTAPIVAGNSSAKPPCAEGEGVVTMGGKVACVPVGASPDIPKVSKNSSTQTFPDGSTKITNTTTTCSGAGACSTTTTITNTGATSGPNAGGAGQAGNPGTTTSEDEESGDDEFCAKNPTLQMCKGGMSEEGTQKLVLAEVKKLSSVDAATDKAAITNAGKYAETPGYQAAKDADDNLVKYASGVTKNTDVEASKTTFEQALSSGFWTDIPSASCTTPTYVIAGHEIEWDRWCEIVGMIQEIGAYGMWVMLAISIFVMLSGGRQT